MKKRWSALVAALVTTALGYAQGDTVAQRYASTIRSEELMDHLRVLASDEYKGRDTGKEGQKMAAAYLKKQFQEMGIAPIPTEFSTDITEGYFQPYALVEEYLGGLRIESGGRTYEQGKGLVYFNLALGADVDVHELVYLGDGTESLGGLDVTGKTVLLDGSKLGRGEAAMGPLRKQVERVRELKPQLILVSMLSVGDMEVLVHGGSRMRLAEGVRPSTSPAGQLVLVDEGVVNSLIRKTSMRKLSHKKPGRILAVDLRVLVSPEEERVIAENVLAYIEGTDLKDEVVILTAHYDHIGVENGVVYNGADDDGSGTVALLEIAEAFAKARSEGYGPRRSVVVMPVSGEEKGLLGSRHYSEHPVFPLERTVADLNIDMIGRVDSAHSTSAPYVYIIGSDRLSTELHLANEEANSSVGLLLDYTFNAESDPNRFYYRSDHYNFARKGVPSIFYFSGVHEDYHQPGDDVEKINPELLQLRAALVFQTAWILANRTERIRVDKPLK